MVVESTISSIDGPNVSNSVLARAASVIVANVAIKVEGFFGRGASPTVISTMTPRVPSEPIIKLARSKVVTAFFVALPSFTISPLVRTTVIARTCWDVTPYLTQHIPPAFVATLPPIVDHSRLAGSGK